MARRVDGGGEDPPRYLKRLRPERPFDAAQGRPELAEGRGAESPGERERGWGTVHFAIRTITDPTRLAEIVRRAIAAVDPAVPLTEFHSQSGPIDRPLRTERLLSFVSGVFGLVASTVAAIGSR